jgi:hypothetical protein
LSFLAVLSFTVFSNLTNRSIQSTRADSLVGTVSFTSQGRYLFVNYTTSTPFLSSILITDKTTNTNQITPVSIKPTKLHYTTITADTSHELFYQIILDDGRGTQTKTDEKPVSMNK